VVRRITNPSSRCLQKTTPTVSTSAIAASASTVRILQIAIRTRIIYNIDIKFKFNFVDLSYKQSWANRNLCDFTLHLSLLADRTR